VAFAEHHWIYRAKRLGNRRMNPNQGSMLNQQGPGEPRTGQC